MSNKKEVMVTVCIVTYNQEKWIRQTLDSVLAQQTDYPFEIIIGEDHGTDGTRAICDEYANRVESGKWKRVAEDNVAAGDGEYGGDG